MDKEVSGLVVMPQYSFPCDGAIHMIEYYASAISPTSLSVWRLQEGIFAQLVHVIELSPQNLGLQQLHLNHTKSIQKGDFIGAGSFTTKDHLSISNSQQGQIGVLKSDIQKAINIDVTQSDIKIGDNISLIHQRILPLALAVNIQYTPLGKLQGR